MKGKKILIIAIIIAALIGVYVVVLLLTKKLESIYVKGGVGIIEVKGILSDSKDYRKDLEYLKKRKDVKALLLYIDSPGGGVVPAQEIYYSVLKFKEEKKVPVVAYISTLGASGAYYVAISADKIMAAPGSITGSIGVIAQYPTLHGLFEKIGIKFRIFKRGKFKDAGSPYREITDEEKKYIEDLLENIYKQFFREVALRRKLDTLNLEKWAEGKIFTGLQAKKLGLVDTIGTYEDALMLAGKLAGIKEKPKEIRPPKKIKGFFQTFIENLISIGIPKIEYRLSLD
ncbi:MAG: signal peptide peptidase SppA [Candidatus Hydrothermales bacterium]